MSGLRKERKLESIEILPYSGYVQLKYIETVYEDDNVLASSSHRECLDYDKTTGAITIPDGLEELIPESLHLLINCDTITMTNVINAKDILLSERDQMINELTSQHQRTVTMLTETITAKEQNIIEAEARYNNFVELSTAEKNALLANISALQSTIEGLQGDIVSKTNEIETLKAAVPLEE